MPGPSFHEWTPLLQQISSVIRCLDFVCDGVREGSFCKISSVTVFAGPIAEAGAEAVGGRKSSGGIALGLDSTKQGGQRHIAQDFFAGRGEDESLVQLVFLERLNKG